MTSRDLVYKVCRVLQSDACRRIVSCLGMFLRRNRGPSPKQLRFSSARSPTVLLSSICPSPPSSPSLQINTTFSLFACMVFFRSSIPFFFPTSSHQHAPSTQYGPQSRYSCSRSIVSTPLGYQAANAFLVWHHIVCLSNRRFALSHPLVGRVIQLVVCVSLEREGEGNDVR